MDKLTLQEATDFFAEFFGGEHHISNPIKPCGAGFSTTTSTDMATFDGSRLTRLVIMAHDKCYRASVNPVRNNILQIEIWKRDGREGDIVFRHPTMEKAVETIRSNYSDKFKNSLP